ncbi:MAG: sulfotransferase family protein [Synechococcaceae cyanobacterium SM2_3_1]|nr:sulfotransferase family protein [Synechococcaceae cyanobacterium SM2_3_1]
MSSPLFWNLPHELRRLVFVNLSSERRNHIHNLREKDPEHRDISSLIPFLQTRSIFVHIPKAAGTSAVYSLYGRKAGDHRTIADYQLCFSQKEFDSFFKFAFVRNPWDRLLSAYLYLKQGGRNREDQEWAETYLCIFETFTQFVQQWVNEENIQLGLHFRPQSDFLCTHKAQLAVDFIGYLEDIDRDYEYIRGKLGIGQPLKTRNQTMHREKDYRQYYSNETIQIVERVYQQDIALLGYTFEGIEKKSQQGRE